MSQRDRGVDDRATLLEPLESAVKAAGFRVGPDALDVATLWCIECGRDAGYHWAECSKGIGAPRTEAKRVEVAAIPRDADDPPSEPCGWDIYMPCGCPKCTAERVAEEPSSAPGGIGGGHVA